MNNAMTLEQDGTTVVARFPGSWLRLDRGPRRRLAEALAGRPRARFAVNGAMFTSRVGSDAFLLRDRAAGLDRPSSVPDEGATIWVRDGVAHGNYGGIAPDDAPVAVQGWPSLVVDGDVTATNVGTNAERDWRVGIGVDAAGRVLVVFLIGTMVALAERMRREGAIVAAYLDGGSSLGLGGDGVSRESPRVVPVPSWIYAEPPASRPSPYLWAGAAVCGALLVVALWPRERPR